jgi:hypothetical protein
MMTPNTEPNGSPVHENSLPAGQTNWHQTDVWATSGGGDLPSSMSGTFEAVANTIGNLDSGDSIIYEPINVAYGTSGTNCVWFQFCVYFYPNGVVGMNIWALWTINGGGYVDDVITNSTGLAYTVGDTYNFALTTSGTNTVTFTIQDVTIDSPVWTNSNWGVTVPGCNLIYYPGGYYSPASCVEGYTTNSQLTDVPTFTTTLGNGENTYYFYPGTSPQGITTYAFCDGGTAYWSMEPATFISSYDSYSNIGKGSVNSPSNIVGTPDNVCAQIYGGNNGDGGEITATLVTSSGGDIIVDGYSYNAGYYSNLYVYVSMNSNGPWTEVGTVTVPPSAEYHINVGAYYGAFNYVSVAGYDTGDSCRLEIDAVGVMT